MRTVAKKYGIQLLPATNMQSHMDSKKFRGQKKKSDKSKNLTNPLSTKDAENNHETVKEVGEVPPWHLASVPVAHVGAVVVPVQLHSHHGKDEDDDDKHEGQVGEGAHSVAHDGQDVIERLPRLCQLEHSEKTERPKHGKTRNSFEEKLDHGEYYNDEVEVIPCVL